MVLDNLRQSLGARLFGSELNSLRKEVQQGRANNEFFRESIADLELALEDVEWMRVGQEGNREFSREGLRKIVQMARIMYLKNPLIKRGINVKKYYVWGQGVNIRAKNDEINQAVQEFLDDERNQKELTSHDGYMYKQTELETDGNLFFVFFINELNGQVRIGSIPFDEIEDVICNPQDNKEPWFYKRTWTEKTFRPGMDQMGSASQQRMAWYPDWRHRPARRTMTSIGGKEIRWQEPIYHVKVGGFSNWKFGVPEIYAAIDWGRAYKEFLEDVATLMRAYSRFAWRIVTKGGKKGVAAVKGKLHSTITTSNSESNPPPTVGSAFIGGEGTDLQPLNVRGASVSPEDGRRLLLMVAASVGLPETFFGDTDAGTLATAKSLDRPTELMMRSAQAQWKGMLAKIIKFILLQAVKAPNGRLKELGTVEEVLEGEQRRERLVWNEERGAAIDAEVDIDFPPLVEEDIKSRIDAIVAAATLGSVGGTLAGTIGLKDLSRMLLNALGEDDVDAMVDELFPEDEDGEGNGRQGNALAAAGEVRRVLETFFERWRGEALIETRGNGKRPTSKVKN